MNTEPARLVVSVHDVSPATASQSRQWVADLDARSVPASLLVVPGPWRGTNLAADPVFVDWLRACAVRGHEICLHGWDHSAAPVAASPRALVGQLAARGCGEFWSLSEEEAAVRAQWGLGVLADLGLSTCGFTPPGWLVSAAAIRGLRTVGLGYVTTHRSVLDLQSGRAIGALAICHRPNSRSERAGAALMALAPSFLLRAGRTLRLALHPDDLARPGLREVALRAIDRALDSGAVALSYASLLGLSPPTHDLDLRPLSQEPVGLNGTVR